MITRIAAEYTAPRQGVYWDRGQGTIEATRSLRNTGYESLNPLVRHYLGLGSRAGVSLVL
jgi:hypothetical protein